MATTRTARALNAAVVGGRIVVGGGTLVAPRTMGRVFGVAPDETVALPYVGRLFGARAVFMALLLATSHGVERRRELRAGVVVDVVDALAAVSAGRHRDLDRRASRLACAAALTEASMGVALLALTRESARTGSTVT